MPDDEGILPFVATLDPAKFAKNGHAGGRERKTIRCAESLDAVQRCRWSSVLMAVTSDRHLVPDRVCGSCTVCCKTLKVDTPELKKLAGVLCHNCVEGVGCRIYEHWPPICSKWYCGWRRIPEMSEHWRPDRCGILVCFVGEGEGIPPEFPQLGLKFDIVESPRVLAWDPLIKFIGSEVANGRPVFLGTPAPVGYERRKVFLNYAMADAVRLRHRPLMLECLEAAYRLGMRDACIEKTIFT